MISILGILSICGLVTGGHAFIFGSNTAAEEDVVQSVQLRMPSILPQVPELSKKAESWLSKVFDEWKSRRSQWYRCIHVRLCMVNYLFFKQQIKITSRTKSKTCVDIWPTLILHSKKEPSIKFRSTVQKTALNKLNNGNDLVSSENDIKSTYTPLQRFTVKTDKTVTQNPIYFIRKVMLCSRPPQ